MTGIIDCKITLPTNPNKESLFVLGVVGDLEKVLSGDKSLSKKLLAKVLPILREYAKVLQEESVVEEGLFEPLGVEYEGMTNSELSKLCKERGVKTSRNKEEKIHNLKNNVLSGKKQRLKPKVEEVEEVEEKKNEEEEVEEVEEKKNEEEEVEEVEEQVEEVEEEENEEAEEEEEEEEENGEAEEEEDEEEEEEENEEEENEEEEEEENGEEGQNFTTLVLDKGPDRVSSLFGNKVDENETLKQEMDRMKDEMEYMEEEMELRRKRIKWLEEDFV